MPFFDGANLTPYERTVRCGLASLGDGRILSTVNELAVLKGGGNWLW